MGAGEVIACSDCGKDFPFTTRDRAFFDGKGWVHPKRCRACREVRRKARGQDPKKRDDRPPTLHAATCTECGGEALVPFRPREGRPVYCAGCHKPPVRTPRL